ncbi:MAG TPA: CoA ester lyase [Rhodospirillaceae bacterium]|nr:CoA ester lyase [Rhodospirillaceae bacterium]HCS70654.1 CoA ester lyase [Rhodospirillaceae bacterium]|tara:strand:+ start:855 stop:1724 length:870 start_codon:yes stop_codon:yes gene_type:complete
MAVHRTYLFAPGNHARRAEKAFTLDCDAVILDLEDAVAVAEKPATRALVVETLKQNPGKRGYVRVNAWDTDFCFNDILAVTGPWLTGLILPKVEEAAQVIAVDWILANIEHDKGMDVGAIDLVPIIETGKGVANVRAIAAAETRVRRLSFGAGDYTKDMSFRWTLAETEIDHARAEIALASRAEGLEPPVDSVWIHIKDTDGLVRSAEKVRDMGYQGKLCIHPDQIGPVNGVFTPTEEQVAFAEKVVAAFEEAEARGLASIQMDGYFIDYPIVDQARRTLDQWRDIQNR